MPSGLIRVYVADELTRIIRKFAKLVYEKPDKGTALLVSLNWHLSRLSRTSISEHRAFLGVRRAPETDSCGVSGGDTRFQRHDGVACHSG